MTTSISTRALLVTNESSREDLAEVMTRINAMARLTRPVIGTTGHPTLWDRRHALLNAMLTDWQNRSV